uniref:Homing endonuclease LAGLIDADG domain-containing protein n=1 Tax=Klebsormidium flaccidum TaxID=3175 RepID=A0A0B5H4X0_KLEFL|nr:hypothetical protein [Klebsormidium flaccidum]
MSTMNIKRSRKNIRNKIHFSYWLAGLIDGDGWLGVSKKGYTCCEIPVGIRELSILSRVKEHLGGSITLRKNIAAYRWRLHNRVGMEKLVDHINGKLLLRKRQEQFQNVCNSLGKYTNQGERIRKGVESLNPDPLASSTSKPTGLPLPFSFDPSLEKKINEITLPREWNEIKKEIFLNEMDAASPNQIHMIQKCETTPLFLCTIIGLLVFLRQRDIFISIKKRFNLALLAHRRRRMFYYTWSVVLVDMFIMTVVGKAICTQQAHNKTLKDGFTILPNFLFNQSRLLILCALRGYTY